MSERKYLDESGLTQILRYIGSNNSSIHQYYKAWLGNQYLEESNVLVDKLLKRKLLVQPVYVNSTNLDYLYPSFFNYCNHDLESNTIPYFVNLYQSASKISVYPFSVHYDYLGWKLMSHDYFDYDDASGTAGSVLFYGNGSGVKNPQFYLFPTQSAIPYFPSVQPKPESIKILGYTDITIDDDSVFKLLSPSDIIQTNDEDLNYNTLKLEFANRHNYKILRENPTSVSTTQYRFGNNSSNLKKTTTMVITYKATTVEYTGTYSTSISYEHDKEVVKALLANSVIASDWEVDSTGTILIAKNSNVEDFNIAFKSALDTISPFAWQKSTTTVTKNVLLQSAIDTANAIYEIRYDFDLNNQTINLPDNCVLYFKGGTFNNGTLTLNDAYIDYKDKAFNNVTFSGNYKSKDNKLGYGAYLKLKDGSLIKSNSNFKNTYSSNEVIGIVCKTKDINLLIPATTLKSAYFCNGTSTCSDVSTIATANIATTYFDGYSTTNLLKNKLAADSNWAVNLAYNTILDGRHCWLPSMGELMNIVSLKDEIATILNKLGITWNFNEVWSSALATLKDGTEYINYVYGYYWKTNAWDGFNCQGAYTVLPVTTAEGSDYHQMIDYLTQSDIIGIVQNNIN